MIASECVENISQFKMERLQMCKEGRLKFELPECVRAAVGLTGHWLQLEALVTSDPPCPGLPACYNKRATLFAQLSYLSV